MEVLPITSLHEEDAPLIPAELIRLSILARNGFPIADGVVVVPPQFHLKTTLERFEFHNREVFEQKLEVIKSELRKIPIPERLLEESRRRNIDAKKLWQHLLDHWIQEIRSGIWRVGLSTDITRFATTQPVFFTSDIKVSGTAYNQHPEHQVVIKLTQGLLNVSLESQIQDLVKKGDKLLYLPHYYEWIVESNNHKKVVKIVKIIPLTPTEERLHRDMDSPFLQSNHPTDGVLQSVKKNAVKVLFSPTNYEQSWTQAEGVFVKGELFPTFEEKAKAASLIPSSELLFYKLTDLQDQYQGVRGTLRLLHQDSILSQDLQAFHFIQQVRKIPQMHMVLPFVRSVYELTEMKKKLHNLGFKRSAKFKLWMELSTTENIINLHHYCAQGLDGVVLNVDELSRWVGGLIGKEEEQVFYHDQVEATLSLLDHAFKIVHHFNVPIIAVGTLVSRGDIMQYLLKKGVWGVVFDSSSIFGAQEFVQSVEKKLIKQSISEKSY